MSKNRIVATTLFALALAACGGNSTKPAETVAAKPGEPAATAAGEGEAKPAKSKTDLAKAKRENCEKYTPIGSNRPVYRCLTPAQKKAEAEANERELRKATAPTAGGVGN
jgi:hypothetical protein